MQLIGIPSNVKNKELLNILTHLKDIPTDIIEFDKVK